MRLSEPAHVGDTAPHSVVGSPPHLCNVHTCSIGTLDCIFRRDSGSSLVWLMWHTASHHLALSAVRFVTHTLALQRRLRTVRALF
jgi:hypothetical protein